MICTNLLKISRAAPLVLLTACVDRVPVPEAGVVTTIQVEPGTDQPSSRYPIAAVPAPEDGKFARQIDYGETKLSLQGSGLCEWGFLKFDLYFAALYVERPPEDIAAALAADQVMIIHLDFVRALSAGQLDQAYTASVRENAGDAFESFAAPLAQLRAGLRDVAPGDSYTFVADPAAGLLVQRGGRVVQAIEDDRFRRLFVRLYLGDKAPTKELRKALLGDLR